MELKEILPFFFKKFDDLISPPWSRSNKVEIKKHSKKIHHIARFISASNIRRNNSGRISVYKEHKPFRPIKHVAIK